MTAIYDQSRKTTRRYAFADLQRLAIGAAIARTDPIDEASEVCLHASSKCFVIVGEAADLSVAAATGLPLEAGEKFHVQIKPGDRVAVIRDMADGFLHVLPVDGALDR